MKAPDFKKADLFAEFLNAPDDPHISPAEVNLARAYQALRATPMFTREDLEAVARVTALTVAFHAGNILAPDAKRIAAEVVARCQATRTGSEVT